MNDTYFLFSKITGAKKVNKPLFYTQCLIQPREWVSGSMCLYMADEVRKLKTKEKRNLKKGSALTSPLLCAGVKYF